LPSSDLTRRLSPAGASPTIVEAVLALPVAALMSVGLFGRTTLQGMTAPWALTGIAAWLAISGWFLWCRRERTRQPHAFPSGLGPLPSAALALAILTVLYVSDTAHHAWVFTAGPKALALSSAALLVWFGGTLRPPIALVLGASGLLHALSFSQVATDDLIRYWGIADGLTRGAGYSVTAGVPGSGEFYLVDLPLFPLFLIPSFASLGHRSAAAQVPRVLANVALPFLQYALVRSCGAGRLRALVLSLSILAWPQYQVYTLGAAQPDPLWAALATAQLLLALLAVRSPESIARWSALGLVSAAAVLTRPEGAVYTALLFTGLLWHQRRQLGGVMFATLIGAAPAFAFAATLNAQFGIWWAAGGWANVAHPRYVIPNVALVVRQNLPYYATVLGLPAPGISGSLLAGAAVVAALVGCVRLWRARPALRGAPLAILANAAIILASPTDLGADRLGPATFFRHASVCVPALVPLLALCLPRAPATAWRLAGATAAAVLIVGGLSVLGATAARTGAGQLTALTSDPYVLVPDLLRMEGALPVLPFRPGPGRGTEIDPAFDYMGFRGNLFSSARPYDLHVSDAGRSFTLAATVFALVGLASTALARRQPD
jgi:hypothetical protein